MTIPNQKPIEQLLAAQRTGNPTPFKWDQVGGQFGIIPGQVFIDDFDLGIVRTLGAFLDPSSPTDEPSFVLPVKGLKQDEQRQTVLEQDVVPVTFGNPEAYMNNWKLPGIFCRREGMEPDLTRYSQELEAFRIPAPNTEIVNGSINFVDPTGPKELMQRQRAEAYNFIYIIDMVARYETDANAMLRTVLPRYKQHKAVIVQDSLGDYNEYTAFLEGIDNIREILGVTMKYTGYSLSLRIIGELDLFDNEIRPAATKIVPEIVVLDPKKVPPPPTTPDGLPLKTGPARVLGTICSMVPRSR